MSTSLSSSLSSTLRRPPLPPTNHIAISPTTPVSSPLPARRTRTKSSHLPSRRSSRSTSGTRQSTRFSEEDFHLTSVSDDVFHDEYNHQDKTLSYCAALSTDLDSSILKLTLGYIQQRRKLQTQIHLPFMKPCMVLIIFYT